MVFFFFWLDVYGCVLSQSNHEHFQKLIESPITVRQKEERDIPVPQDNLKGKSCFADSFLVP